MVSKNPDDPDEIFTCSSEYSLIIDDQSLDGDGDDDSGKNKFSSVHMKRYNEQPSLHQITSNSERQKEDSTVWTGRRAGSILTKMYRPIKSIARSSIKGISDLIDDSIDRLQKNLLYNAAHRNKEGWNLSGYVMLHSYIPLQDKSSCWPRPPTHVKNQLIREAWALSKEFDEKFHQKWGPHDGRWFNI